MSERVVAPMPGRLAWARRAGLRPRARWLWIGLWCLGVGIGARVLWPSFAAWSAGLWATSMQGRGVWPSLPVLVGGLLLPGLLAASALVLAHLGVGALGPISSRERRRIDAGPVRAPLRLLALGGLGVLVAFLAIRPVVGGAARAVDATGPALALLWQTWFMRAMGQVGAALVLLGLAEAWIQSRALRRALHQTPADARRERQEAGRG